MKTRSGFVSNSSSSSFILDKRNPKIKKWAAVWEKTLPRAWDLGRETARADGSQAANYAKQWIEKVSEFEDREWNDNVDLGPWILKHFKNLGENLVFLRISDEDDIEVRGGDKVGELAIESIEYH